MRSAILAATCSTGMVSAAIFAVANECAHTAFLWSVADGASSQMFTIPSGVGYQEKQYRTIRNGQPTGAVSIKIAPYHNNGAVPPNPLQVEYNADDSTNDLWYDVSCVNGNAYRNTSTTLYPSATDSSGGYTIKNCKPVLTTRENEICYEFATDDQRNMHDCDAGTDLLFTLCADGTDSDDDDSDDDGPWGNIGKRDAEADPICVGPDNLIVDCNEIGPIASATVAPVSTPTSTSAAATSTTVAATKIQNPAPIVALQQSSTESSSSATTTTAQPVSTTIPASSSNALDDPHLKLIANARVTSWIYGPGPMAGQFTSREIGIDSEPKEAYQAPARRRRHLHSHANLKLSHSH